jgi:O-antigen/teichoic acid export membrane protein
MIQYWLNNENLGIYTFYANFTNVAQTIVFTLVVMIHSPKILEFANQKDFDAYKRLKILFNKQITTISIISFMVVIVTIFIAIHIIGKTTLYENLTTFFILNFSILIQNYMLIYYYDLYSFKKDKKILISTIMGATLNIILNIILIPQYGIIGAAFATLLSIISILITQYTFTKELKYA